MVLFIHYFNDGGSYIMYPILILLVVISALFVKALIAKGDFSKTKSLIASIGWFAIAWGYLGRTIGFIQAFDNIEASGEITPQMLSGGLKMALLGPLAGIIVFIVARLFMIILAWPQRNNIENSK